MKTAALLIALATLAGTAQAQSGTTAPAAPAAPAATAAPAAKSAEPVTKAPGAAKKTAPTMKAKSMTGEVVSVDATGKTVTLKHTVKGKAEEMTLGAGEKAVAVLGTLKAGDQIQVAYADVDGKPVASTITKVVKK